MNKKYFLTDMTRVEVDDMLKKVKIVIIPTGSTEQHGSHLPVSTDMRACLHIVEKAAEKLYPKILVTPPVTIGYSPHHLVFPGTLTLKSETFINILVDICRSLKHYGTKKIAIINGHGGNEPLLAITTRRVRDELGLKILATSYWHLMPRDKVMDILDTKVYPGHACEFETSMALAIYPEFFETKEFPKIERTQAPRYLKFRPIPDMTEISPQGIGWDKDLRVGDPSPSTVEKGRKLIELAVNSLVSVLKEYMEARD